VTIPAAAILARDADKFQILPVRREARRGRGAVDRFRSTENRLTGAAGQLGGGFRRGFAKRRFDRARRRSGFLIAAARREGEGRAKR
jgi:hypothetical protein